MTSKDLRDYDLASQPRAKEVVMKDVHSEFGAVGILA